MPCAVEADGEADKSRVGIANSHWTEKLCHCSVLYNINSDLVLTIARLLLVGPGTNGREATFALVSACMAPETDLLKHKSALSHESAQCAVSTRPSLVRMRQGRNLLGWQVNTPCCPLVGGLNPTRPAHSMLIAKFVV